MSVWKLLFVLMLSSAVAAAGRDEQTNGLVTLVRDAVAHNLSIEEQRWTPTLAAAEIQAAKSVFDPAITFGPQISRYDEAVATANGSREGRRFGSAISGGTGGLLPYSAASVAGNLPTGTQYDVSFRSERISRNALITSPNPIDVSSNLTVSLAHPLLRGAGASLARSAIRAAELRARATRASFDRIVEQTIADVETAYWSLALARGLESAAGQSLQRAVTLLERNEELLRLELVAPVDVTSARQGVARRRAAVVEARTQRENVAAALVFLVYGREAPGRLGGADAIATASLPDTADAMVVLDLERIESDALATRPDLAAARLEVDRSRVQLELARNSLRPGLFLTGSYSAITEQTRGLRLFGAGEQGLASAGFTTGLLITLPVGNNAGKAALQQATAATEQRGVAIATVESGIRADLRVAIRLIRAAQERVALTAEALSLAVAQFEAESERLRLGLSDAFRLLQFEEAVAEAQANHLGARFDLAQALVAHSLARGGATERYGIPEVK